MRLIGMLDSPYVRRVAIALQLLDLRFEHQSLSVFSTFEQFAQINPVVKAPTLICDDGGVLMDSALILQYAHALSPARCLVPTALAELQNALRIEGLALAACEKAVQIVYERKLRPAEKLHEPWVARVAGQLRAACDGLERALAQHPLAATSAEISQAGVSTAVAWHFIQQMVPDMVPVERYPGLVAYAALAEALPEFSAAPHGDSVYRRGG